MPGKNTRMAEKSQARLSKPLLRKLEGLDRRLLPHELDSVIEELCGCGAWGLREMAGVLNRSPVYLQNTSIKRLLAEGRIRFAHAGEPNHPRQAYVATAAKPKAEPLPEEPALSIGIND